MADVKSDSAAGPSAQSAPNPLSQSDHQNAPTGAQDTTSSDTAIEAEAEGESDVDSSLGDDTSSYTASLTSTVLDYQYENGRRYHAYKSGAYILPNDEQELDRLDLTNGMIRHMMKGRNFVAPIGRAPQRILDIGTGTGIWVIDMGDEFPSAEIIGTDLSATQPTVPPNVKFEIDDCESSWTFTHKFDFIHGRYLAGAIRDWPKLMKQAYDNLTPGGWVEWNDFNFKYYSDDGSLTKDHSLALWNWKLAEAYETFGADSCPGPHLESWVRDAGFTNVVCKKYKIPIGTWPKDKEMKVLGAWGMLFTLESLEAVTLKIYTTVLGWRPEEVQVLLANTRKDLKNSNIHAVYEL
ncbi:MAG: hypothetical protein M1833_004241 [Piccolia ochrophora]|nr:MAG: hypothetical protein M1833_004241 [Piccolia ochrophora]